MIAATLSPKPRSSCSRITLPSPRIGKSPAAPPSNSRAGCSFSHPRLTTSGCPAEIGVQSDVPQRADGYRRARRIDGHAAAVGMGDGDHAVHVGKARQNLRPDAPRGILHGGRHALHRGREAQNVLRSGTVRIAVALERVAFERRQCGGTAVASGNSSSGGAAGISSISSRTQLPAAIARLASPMVWP